MRSHFPRGILYFLQVLVAMSHPVNRPCSPYLASMATLRLRWSSSQVTTVTLFSTRVQASVHPLVTDTTCTCTTTTLQATAVPTPTVCHLTPLPWVLCIWFFLSILCRILQIHSHWCGRPSSILQALLRGK